MPTINAIGTPQITLGGTFTMSGAYTFIGQLVGNTNVTFPTSGTLATTGGTVQSIQGTANQVLVNGTSGSPVTGTAIILTTPQDIALTSSPTFSNITLTGGNLIGSNAHTVLTLGDVASAVNFARIVNSITGEPVHIQAIGTDTNVDLHFDTKGTGKISLLSGSPTLPVIIVSGTLGNHFTNFQMSDTSASWTYIWPDANGTIALGGSTIPSIQGTANQVLVNGTSGTPVTGTAVILTTPQDIATSSSPTFAGVTAGNINITANTISSINSNGNIDLIPNGSGQIMGFSTTALGLFSNSIQLIKPGSDASFVGTSYRALNTGSHLYFVKSRSTTVGSFTAVQNSDQIGGFQGWADNGSSLVYTGGIEYQVSAALSGVFVPTSMRFYTSSSVAAGVLALTIDNTQVATFASNVLVPAGAITAGSNIQSTLGALVAGQNTGGIVGTLFLYPTTAGSGSLQMLSQNNAGAFINTLQNVSTTAARTWSLPDADGTLALTSGIPSLGNYSFSGNIMTVASGAMQFTLPSSALLIVGSGDTNVNLASTSATGKPYINFLRNTSTQIGAIQAGTDSGGGSSGSGMFYFNGISNGPHYFYSVTAGNFATLSPAGSAIASALNVTGILSAAGGDVRSGSGSGQADSSFYAFSQTASLGVLGFRCADNGGNYVNILTNASTSSGRTWTLPDATGTIALTSGIPSLGNYSFSANTMNVSSGAMLFTSAGLNMASFTAGASAVNYLNFTSVSTTNSPVIGAAGTDSDISIRYQPKAGGIHNFLSTSSSPFIFQTGTGYQHTTTLVFSDTAASRSYTFPEASGSFILSDSSGIQFISSGSLGISAGGFLAFNGNAFTAFSTTSNMGSIALQSPNNAGNFGNILTNASTSAARTWTLPDITGTVAVPINGTFTPTFTFATPGDQSISYAIQNGSYTQIGRVVYFSYSLRFTPTYTTASGNALFGGFPVAIDNTISYQILATASQGNAIWPAGTTQIFFTTSSTSAFLLSAGGSATVQANFGTTQFLTGVQQTISATGFYFV